ncbi:glycosyltransferase [bacterium]|nr:glycosyltransferase [bacterium]
MSSLAGRSLLVTNTSRSWGGNEHWAVQVAAGLAARGARVRFVWTHEAVGERVREAGLEHRRLRLRADGDLPGVLRLREEIAAVQADAVLPTRWREYLHVGLAARLVRGRPRVVLRLGLNVRPRDDLKRRLVFAMADRILVNAPEIRDTLAAVPWLDADRVHVVLNGLDLERWPPRWDPDVKARGRALRAELGIAEGVPLLLAVGAFSPQKDLGGLLEAMTSVHRRVPAAHLLLLGDGFLRPEIEARRDALGLTPAVRMPGFRRDVAAAMAAADLLVLSSVNEGMARVLIEAAASGLPVVATDVSGTRLAVRHDTTGMVVAPADPAALADAVVTLLTDPDRRRRMGRSGRRLAEDRFAADRMLDETAAVLFGSGRL